MSKESKRLSEIVSVIRKYHLIKEANPVSVREALEELGPTFIKMGQIMSSRPDLIPNDYCVELKKLRSKVKPVPYEVIIDILEKEYSGKTFSIFEHIDELPLGSASIAQTHKAKLKTGEEVVVKIARENIYELMTQDTKLLKSAASILQLDKIFSSVMDVNDFLDEMYNTALEEMDFVIEAKHMNEFSINNNGINYLQSIKVYSDYSTRNVLVMEYIDGCNINDLDFLNKNGYDIEEISEKLASNYIKQALDDGFFHADPHSDNIKILNGKIVFLDFGMMGRLSGRNRKLLEECVNAIVSSDYTEVGHVLSLLNTNNYPIDHMKLNNDIKKVLDKNKTEEIVNIDIKTFAFDMFAMLNDNRIILPRDITMLLRGIIVIAGLLEEINPKISLIQVLQNRYTADKIINKDNVKKYVTKSVKSGMDLMLIPKEVLSTLKGINTGELRFNVEMTDSTGQISRMEKLFHLGIVTVLDVALIIGISLMNMGGTTNTELYLFYIICAIICTIWLFFKMFISRIKRK